MAANVKSRQERVVIVVKEVKILWKKLNLPIQKGKSTVERKIENVLNKYEKDSRKPGTQDFTNLFNVTDENGEWLCQEDKAFYNLQMSTNGRAGYCTTIEDTQGVHPRKLKNILALKKKNKILTVVLKIQRLQQHVKDKKLIMQ